ncbi:MAG: hypothetical protein IJW16_01205 [Clostridia bacterium]|nr:hypothetical protein [Clostridia bacterium]
MKEAPSLQATLPQELSQKSITAKPNRSPKSGDALLGNASHEAGIFFFGYFT